MTPVEKAKKYAKSALEIEENTRPPRLGPVVATISQTWALLAIAEQLERIANTLEKEHIND
jgi:hypothetical protein